MNDSIVFCAMIIRIACSGWFIDRSCVISLRVVHLRYGVWRIWSPSTGWQPKLRLLWFSKWARPRIPGRKDIPDYLTGKTGAGNVGPCGILSTCSVGNGQQNVAWSDLWPLTSVPPGQRKGRRPCAMDPGWDFEFFLLPARRIPPSFAAFSREYYYEVKRVLKTVNLQYNNMKDFSLKAILAQVDFDLLAYPGWCNASPGTKHQTHHCFCAWRLGGAWQFRKVDSLLTAKGYLVYRPTPGLGERAHLASTQIGLKTHILDVVNTILFEDLRHRFGGSQLRGMVVTGVADSIPDRINKLIYLDAFARKTGEACSVSSVLPERNEAACRKWICCSMVGQNRQTSTRGCAAPGRTLTDPVTLTNPARLKIPTTYILTVERQGSERWWLCLTGRHARQRGWPVLQLEADHNPQWFTPKTLMAMIEESSNNDWMESSNPAGVRQAVTSLFWYGTCRPALIFM